MRPQRLELVCAIRDAAVQVAQAQGSTVTVAGIRVRRADVGGLRISLSPWGLDIWPLSEEVAPNGDRVCGNKIFSLLGRGEHVGSFKRGPWVEQLLTSSAPAVIH